MAITADLHACRNIGVLELAHLSGVAIDDVPSLPAATARCGTGPGWSGSTIVPPEPKSVSFWSRAETLAGVKKSTTLLRSGANLTMVSAISVVLLPRRN